VGVDLLSGAQIPAAFLGGYCWPRRPFGFIAIAMLEDRAPASYDSIRSLSEAEMYWRVPIESAAFVTVWSLAFELMVLKRDLMIRYESFTSGTQSQR